MDIVDRLRGKEITHSNTPYAEIAKEAAAEITRLRATIPTEDALDNATSEGYEQGYADGQNDCQGAYADLWSMLLRHLKKHDCEPASDDGYSHNAHQMMDAVFEREGNLQREIERLRKERDEARAASVSTVAARDVLAERQRQASVEHWTPHHDDNHTRMELSRAARCYVLKAIRREIDDISYNPHLASDEQYQEPYPRWEPPPEWPWESTAWKPKGTRADLVRAGALVLAEIERLDRAALPPPEATK